ncbi:dihydroorotase [Pandoraea nosoerga]|uniref:Dihydroorotase n=1 Tax=Pandoraea nosoerga TaxID=2508296 RepID=A0A5E4T6S2_9BURK|nr:dihydroorotase [Pandoraea nosoerga]MBN4664244.1 dihydroorotase [Pandoraea nosoerga]MBN4675861.1 dihydroorotase [Pandoraea nosoerga]MBN4679332.1 dihydroorotase [Pandoraea nosoerga]MBN4743671.1 dihydroorotase [Pandoraea nosoerga]VVD83547.1 dihydroorotase [Pandoraea nosoerga]
MKLHLKGGRFIDPATRTDRAQDVFIADGKIVALDAAPADFTAEQTVDVAGAIVMPGLVDLAARRVTAASEAAAALAGGVTRVVCPPDTDPVLDEPDLVEMLQLRARATHRAQVHPLGALTVGLAGRELAEMAQLAQAGCIGLSQASAPMPDTRTLLRALQYAGTFGLSVWLRPQDAPLAAGGVAASGAVASRLGLAGIPVAAETIALHTILELVRITGTRVHLCRLSSAAGVALVRAAKAEGLPVTCDVAAHHLHLTDMDIGYFDAQHRLDPPLRGGRDRDTIRDAARDGTIDAICSDHTPLAADARLVPFAEAAPGASGLELLLSLVLKWADEARVPLVDALARVTHGPGQRLGAAAPGAGRLAAGLAADVCVFAPSSHWTVSAQQLRSAGHNTPFLGYELPGSVRLTLVGGHVAYHALAV